MNNVTSEWNYHSLIFIKSGDEDLDVQDEFSVVFGFEFERTFKTKRTIQVEFITNSYSKDVVVEAGKISYYSEKVLTQSDDNMKGRFH